MVLLPTWMTLDRGRVWRERSEDAQCPICGSLLDAARVNPLTGNLGRKCLVCLDWYEPDGTRSPNRSE